MRRGWATGWHVTGDSMPRDGRLDGKSPESKSRAQKVYEWSVVRGGGGFCTPSPPPAAAATSAATATSAVTTTPLPHSTPTTTTTICARVRSHVRTSLVPSRCAPAPSARHYPPLRPLSAWPQPRLPACFVCPRQRHWRASLRDHALCYSASPLQIARLVFILAGHCLASAWPLLRRLQSQVSREI